MLDIISRAKNAIEAYNTALRIHSANIANMNVDGYKRLNISFQSIFESILSRGTPAMVSENLGGTNPLQLGTGMAISQIGVDFAQGDLTEGGFLDLAIAGSGLFVVSPDGGNTYLYTRSGRFHADAYGNLVTDTGMQVYGLRRIGGITSTGALTPIVISYDTTVYPTSEYAVSFDENGVLSIFILKGPSTLGDKVAELDYQIALTTFNNLSGLEQRSATTFAETLASGEPLSPTTPGYGTVGVVVPRQLERSNVFYIGETIDSMEAQRAMSGNLTVVRLVSDMISTFINRLG